MPSKLNRKDTKKWRRRRKLRRFLISSWVVVDIHVSFSFNCLHILFRDGWWVGPVNGPGKTWFWVGLGWHLNLQVSAHLELDQFIDCNRNVNSNIKMPSQHLKSTRSWVFKFGWKCQLDHRISTLVSGSARWVRLGKDYSLVKSGRRWESPSAFASTPCPLALQDKEVLEI